MAETGLGWTEPREIALKADTVMRGFTREQSPCTRPEFLGTKTFPAGTKVVYQRYECPTGRLHVITLIEGGAEYSATKRELIK